MTAWLNADGRPYDPHKAIIAWQDGDASAGEELFEQLYHQGAVNTASYAAAEEIVNMIMEASSPEWHAYALLSFIEEGRQTTSNPALPPELQAS
ncbi:hypothetical protein [Sphingomonas sp. Root710]|uniref:hypothetical protein n=1 Tax=Sphingomonas sp. Root710 TaxID=1736594 RepID=UPI000B333923|nr:hypothetical protein [Sphingomonas sp. Root710]